jgi:hypothetical protein
LDQSPEVLDALFEQIKRVHSPDFSGDIKAARNEIFRALRALIPLNKKRGRPKDEKIAAVARMLNQGILLREILEVLVSGFKKLDPDARLMLERQYRAAITRFSKRQENATKIGNDLNATKIGNDLNATKIGNDLIRH